MGRIASLAVGAASLMVGLTAPLAVPQPPPAPAVGSPLPFQAQEIARDFGVGYAVATGDVNGDRRLDAIAISGTQLVWFENPTWTAHVLLDGQTPKDNVALAPHDIDSDGRLDVALGAAWNPRDTTGGGTLHWVRQGASGESWALLNIASEPTLHRIRWANVDGRGAPELIVAPLHGRGTSPPDWNGPGARLLVFRIPSPPATKSWEMEIADDSLHILHNFAVVRFDSDQQDDLLTASREGVHLLRRASDGTWRRTRIGEGAPGEIKMGRIGGRRILATIEPWHGHSVVLYLEPDAHSDTGRAARPADRADNAPAQVWTRRVVDDQLAGGHALGWADFDGDGQEELAAGWRDKEGGLAIYHLDREGAVVRKNTIDAGGMATEDLVIADLDADKRPDIVASGRRTANVKIYWNRTPRASAQIVGAIDGRKDGGPRR
jgi:FG-GAP-like repeat